MVFVVETGTGTDPLANSYVSLADADAYFLNRNVTDWASYSDVEKQGSLVYATAYLDDTVQWYGAILSTSQPLDWPRSTFYDSEGRIIESGTIPQKLKDAVCELALQNTQEALNDTSSDGVASEKIGSSTITYSGGGSSTKSYSFIKVMLKDLGTTGAANNAKVYRG